MDRSRESERERRARLNREQHPGRRPSPRCAAAAPTPGTAPVCPFQLPLPVPFPFLETSHLLCVLMAFWLLLEAQGRAALGASSLSPAEVAVYTARSDAAPPVMVDALRFHTLRSQYDADFLQAPQLSCWNFEADLCKSGRAAVEGSNIGNRTSQLKECPGGRPPSDYFS